MTTSCGPVPEAFLPVPADSLQAPSKSSGSEVSVSSLSDSELLVPSLSVSDVPVFSSLVFGALLSFSPEPDGPVPSALELPVVALLEPELDVPVSPVSPVAVAPDVPLAPDVPVAPDEPVVLGDVVVFAGPDWVVLLLLPVDVDALVALDVSPVPVGSLPGELLLAQPIYAPLRLIMHANRVLIGWYDGLID